MVCFARYRCFGVWRDAPLITAIASITRRLEQKPAPLMWSAVAAIVSPSTSNEKTIAVRCSPSAPSVSILRTQSEEPKLAPDLGTNALVSTVMLHRLAYQHGGQKTAPHKGPHVVTSARAARATFPAKGCRVSVHDGVPPLGCDVHVRRVAPARWQATSWRGGPRQRFRVCVRPPPRDGATNQPNQELYSILTAPNGCARWWRPPI